MLRAMWYGFVARKVRVTLTAVAIALGVALMAGTYILTDTINASFASIFASTNSGNAAVISPNNILGKNAGAQISPITQAMLARVRRVPGVASAAGEIFGTATLIGPSGKTLTGLAPGFVASVMPPPFESAIQVSGHAPTTNNQADLDEMTVRRAGLHLGDTLRLAGVGAAHRFRLVGTYQLQGASSFGGASVALVVLPEAQALVGEVGRYDQIDAAARAGISPVTLRDRIAAALPTNVTVRTGQQQAATEATNSASQLGFLRTFLLVFAYVALFVGGFIILNTFSITVAQRTREIGLLRAVGASRGQILAGMVGECLLLGLIGSAIGLGLGLLAAPALDQIFKSLGADLPDSGTVLETRTVIVSLLAGMGASLMAGLAPSLRATRVPPVAAMRAGVAPEPSRLARHSLAISLFTFSIGALMIGVGLAGGGTAAVGGGALAVFIGIALASPRLVPPLAKALGLLVTWRGVTGVLARENARRQPGRTAVTASALMIGLALVTFVSIVASSTKATINSAVNGEFAGNLIVEPSSNSSNSGVPASLATALRRLPGIATVAAVNFSEAKVAHLPGTQPVTGVTGPALSRLYRVDWVRGSVGVLAGLRGEQAVVTRSFASSNHITVGTKLALLTPAGRHLDVTVEGIASDRAGLFGAITIARPMVERYFSQSTDGIDFVGYRKGASNTLVQPAVDALLARQYPQAKALTAAQFKTQQASQVGATLTLIYVLLALAVVVSLFGLVNTLVLSMYERTREIGLLRAVGTSRRQIRQMVRYESVITSLIGAVSGMAIGTAFGAVLVWSLGGAGAETSVPLSTMATLLVVATAAGVAAALLPARRASRLEILGAITSE
jgi:putative ABC transport system permease protein